MTDSDWGILSGPAVEVAPRLLGSLLIRELDGQRLVGKIVETEAYDQTDAASHSYRGNTQRTKVTFGDAGHLYVHASYGLHYCCDIVTDKAGYGASVLVRAIEPLEGIDVMRLNRGIVHDMQLTNGPGKLCQALKIDRQLNGHDLRKLPLRLVLQPALIPEQIITAARIGITKSTEQPWRFYVKNSPYVSKKT